MVTVLSVLVGTPGGKAQDSKWVAQMLAEGPDASGQRVITPDIATAGDNVYVSYISQSEKKVWLLISRAKGAEGSWQREVVADPGAKVISSTVTAAAVSDGHIVCISWQQDDFGVYQRCAKITADAVEWLGDPALVSTEGEIAGQHDLNGDWGGNLDNTSWADGGSFIIYMTWAESYNTLKAAKSTDGVNWQACGDIPDQPGDSVRYPTIYADSTGTVWVATAQANSKPEILVWMSKDQCASWKGPTNTSSNGGFSDAPGIVRLKDKIYEVNDDDTTNPQDADIHLNICDVTDEGAANCQPNRVLLKNGGFPNIATDGKGLYVTADAHETRRPFYIYSCDAGENWGRDDLPVTSGQVFIRDADFGINYSRVRIAAGTENVYMVWFDRGDGKSRIWLGLRPKDCP